MRDFNELYKWGIAAGFTGVLAGLGAILFNYTLNASILGFNKLIQALPDPKLIIIVPAVGGLMAGIIRYLTVPEAFSSCCATDNMIDIIHKENGQTKAITPFATIITSAFTLGSGGSAGRECPTALIGTGFGSLSVKIINKLKLDKFLKLRISKKDIRTLSICGAAAGIGAIFRAPIGGALFSASVLYINGMEIEAVTPAFISSIIAYLIFSIRFGFEALYKAPFTWSFNFFDLFIVSIIAVVASVVGYFYIKVFYKTFEKFGKLPLPNYLKPAIGGLLLGLIVLVIPRVMGMGYETIQAAIDYKLAMNVLLVLVFAKIIATSFSISSGGAGGVIAPSLFIGAALGGFFGKAAMIYFPQARAHPALYVIAGMGALYSAVGKVPLSTAIILSEATRNFTMIFPLVISNSIAFLASGDTTIYEGQRQDMIKEKKRVLSTITVDEIMQSQFEAVSPHLTVNQLLQKVRQTEHHGYPVLHSNKLVGIVSWHDTRDIPIDKRDIIKVDEIMTQPVISVIKGSRVREALDLLDKHKIGRVVVVAPGSEEKVIGVVTRQNIMEAYLKAIEF